MHGFNSTKETIKSKLTPLSVGAASEAACSEMDQLWQLNDNPLLNDVILSNLFEFMRGKDLKKCRLVCKKWNKLALPSARSKFRAKVNGFDEVNSVRDFVEVFKGNRLGIPFDKYILNPFCTTEGPGQEFLRICGNTAKGVSLIQQSEPHVFSVEDILELLKAIPNIEFFHISKKVPSRSGNIVKLFQDDSSTKPTLTFLKNLIFYDCDLEADKTVDFCPTFIEEIFAIAPNVSDVRVHDSRFNSTRSRIGQVLKAIEKFERESVITNLHLINGTTEHFQLLQSLAENGLKLKNIDFYFRSQEDEEEDKRKSLALLASLFKNSIEHLCVDAVCPSFIALPHMPNLKTLDFHILEDFDSKSVDLNKLCPVLTELVMYYWDFKDDVEWEELFSNSEPCPNVKLLSLSRVTVRIQLFDHILNIFPKLTKIELDVGKDGVQILRKIMTELTQLESLTVGGTIEGVESIDALLTGIPVQKIHEFDQVVKELTEMTAQLRADVIRHYRTRHCQSPSIANLTNLKYLHMSITGIGDSVEGEDPPKPTTGCRCTCTGMTDVFAFFGLYSMKHLNKLKIENCEFTEAASEILMAEIGLCSGDNIIHDDDDES